jgi:hypothetical protein
MSTRSVLFRLVVIGSLAGCSEPQGNGRSGDNGGDDLATGEAADLAAPAPDLSAPTPPPVDMSVPNPMVKLAITPADQVLQYTAGTQPLPSVQYAATADGVPIAPSWSLDRGELGTVGVSNGKFVATGAVGGLANVTASYHGQTVSTTVTIAVSLTQTGGDPANPPGKPGAGGYGGVGGDGPAPGASSGQQGTLNGTPTADGTVKILYPYDGTVWPRGLLAPLIQWDPGTHKFDSVLIQLQENGFNYKGYFAAQSTATGFTFKNIPIPQAVWKELGNSNDGKEAVTVSLIFGEGGNAYGPYTLKWKIARGALRGTVYYNSYGTAFVQNSGEPSCGPTDPNCPTLPSYKRTGPAFGAATLGIHPGDTAPTLIAGYNIPNPTSSYDRPGCRACHSVSANGQRLIVNDPDNDYDISYIYDLTQPPANSSMEYPSWKMNNNPNNPTYPNKYWSNVFPALTADGQYMLSSAGNDRGDTSSNLYSTKFPGNPSALTSVNGLNGLKFTLPTFAPNSKHIAFNDASYDGKSLGIMDFDISTLTFSNHTHAFVPVGSTSVVSWSSFLPTSDGVVFQIEHGNLEPGLVDNSALGYTRGNSGELWWYDLNTKKAAPLGTLNGLANGQLYVPTNANHHTAAIEPLLNYEPTVCPIASGGYAWVVFTSRRIYGNVATQDPYQSDPRNYDWQNQVTTKKLWVAAIDLHAAGGTDPSHPAFYLPAQELYAGNARGFWTAVSCHQDGDSCETGDECCGGYCRPGADPGDGGVAPLMCLSTPPSCSAIYEKCSTKADCCGHEQGGVDCVNNICSTGGIT